MTNFGPFGGGSARPTLPTPPRGEVLARYGTYAEAQRSVDYLSDHHFPVQFVTIVGTDLRMVERVTGRLSYGRVAVAGALSGAWFGLFVGLLLSLFSNTAGFSVFAAIVIGAGFGMLFGVISYAFTGGRRDFTSTSQIVASEYQVLCLEEQAGQALQLLSQLPGGRGRGPGASGGGPGNGLGLGGPFGGPGGGAPATVAPIPPSEPGGPAQPQPPAPEQPVVSGPTYGEMIERQRQERLEAERQAAQQEAERRAAQQEAERRAQAEREGPAPGGQ